MRDEMTEVQFSEFVNLPTAPNKHRSLVMLETAAKILDEGGNTSVPIVLYQADFKRVRKLLGITERGPFKYGEHTISNGGPKFRRRM